MSTITEAVTCTKDACHVAMVPGKDTTRFVVTCKTPYLRSASADKMELECDGKGLIGETFWDKESASLLTDYSGAYQGSLLNLRLRTPSGTTVCGKGSSCYFTTEADPVSDPNKCGQSAMHVDMDGGNGERATPAMSAKEVFMQLSLTDRLLSVWIIGAMIIGVILGNFTNISQVLDTTKIDTVSLPIAIGLWLMMWPVLTKVRYELLGELARDRSMWAQMGLSLVANWVVGPLLMLGLAWATLPDLPGYRTGVILVGIARCIAMVLIWNQLARGHPEYCAVLVAFNSIMQMILYSPLALLYVKVIGGQDIHIDFWEVCKSVLIFLGAPLVAGIVTRYSIIALKGRAWLDNKFMPWFGPVALLALIYTVLVLFGMQGERVIHEIGSVFRVAIPMLLYFSIMWLGTLFFARRMHSTYAQTVTQSFTAASNNFELAIAIAVGTFGVESQEALAATIGPLIEVPVLLALVYVALWLGQRLKWDAPKPGTEGHIPAPLGIKEVQSTNAGK